MQRLCAICDAPLVKKPGPGRWPHYCGDLCRREAGRRSCTPRPTNGASRSDRAASASRARWARLSAEERAEAGYQAAAARWGTQEPRRKAKSCASCGRPIQASNTSLPQGEAKCRPCRAEFMHQNTVHGASRYSKGCRCDPCRLANNERMRRYTRARRQREGLPDRPCAVCSAPFGPSRPQERQCSPCRSCVDCGQQRMKGKPRCAQCSRQRASLLRAVAQPGPTCKVFYGDCVICQAPFAARYTTTTCSDTCARERVRDKSREKGHRRRVRLVNGYVERVIPRRIYERDKWRCHICRKLVSKTAVVPHPRAATIDHLVPLAALGTHEPANVATACFACNCLKGDRGGNEQLLLIG